MARNRAIDKAPTTPCSRSCTAPADGHVGHKGKVMSDAEFEAIKLAIIFLSGGLAGALLNVLVSRRRQQVEFVIKITDRYLDEFAEIAACKSILSSSSALQDTINLNRIRKLGDWFELIAIFHNSRYLSKHLLTKVGLLGEFRKFHELVTQRKNETQSPLNDAWLWWPTFDALIRGLK